MFLLSWPSFHVDWFLDSILTTRATTELEDMKRDYLGSPVLENVKDFGIGLHFRLLRTSRHFQDLVLRSSEEPLGPSKLVGSNWKVAPTYNYGNRIGPGILKVEICNLVFFSSFANIILLPSQNDSPYSQNILSQNDCRTTKPFLYHNDCHVPIWFIEWYVSSLRRLSTPGKILEAQTQILSSIKVIIKKTLDIRTSGGCSGVVGVFYFERHTYNYLDNHEWTLILPN